MQSAPVRKIDEQSTVHRPIAFISQDLIECSKIQEESAEEKLLIDHNWSVWNVELKKLQNGGMLNFFFLCFYIVVLYKAYISCVTRCLFSSVTDEAQKEIELYAMRVASGEFSTESHHYHL